MTQEELSSLKSRRQKVANLASEGATLGEREAATDRLRELDARIATNIPTIPEPSLPSPNDNSAFISVSGPGVVADLKMQTRAWEQKMVEQFEALRQDAFLVQRECLDRQIKIDNTKFSKKVVAGMAPPWHVKVATPQETKPHKEEGKLKRLIRKIAS